MPNEKVALKYLCNSQNITNEFLDEECEVSKIYGISQNPDTKNYILVHQDGILCDKYKSQNNNECLNKIKSYFIEF
ncbi:unnamed protein product [Rhizophagus irregularis]|nr:unnamed protein product [Rhizophagus irregularis]